MGPPQCNHKASYKYHVSTGFVPNSWAVLLTLPSSDSLFVLSKHTLLKIIIALHLPNALLNLLAVEELDSWFTLGISSQGTAVT